VSKPTSWIDSQFHPPKCGCIIGGNAVVAQCPTHRHARVMQEFILKLHVKVSQSADGNVAFGTGPKSHQQALTELCHKLIQ
jgi:hypothetical protein